MPSALPSGDPAPVDGSLPESSVRAVGERPLGIYLHVPFCRTRCGYCDFNTYTPTELLGRSAEGELRVSADLAETGDAYVA
ncbi:MAG TPA: coproporphyrinogen III oxidase, partial [Microlunatus sp.]